ncbi:RidA family protein [Rhodococcus sp. WS4]|nr:RidA family protein [Rhodococcus sp. WS4]
MRRRSIDVEGLHHGGAPIPQASLVGSLLLSSGINGMDPQDGTIPEDPDTQASLIFDNIRRILKQAGGNLDDVVKCTFFVRDLTLKAVIDTHWLEAFPDPSSRPARHTLVQDLTVQALQCEIVANIERPA